MSNLEKAKDILINSDYTCVVVGDNEIRTSSFSGIRPLMEFLAESESIFKDTSIADRCIGRAAAFLMIYGGVKEIYTPMISEHALSILEKFHIPVVYQELVPYIINRDQTDMCPMEKTCLHIESPVEAYIALKDKLAAMQHGKSS